MLEWLKENPPQDVDYLTLVNQRELCDNTIEVVKADDAVLQYQQYLELSQG